MLQSVVGLKGRCNEGVAELSEGDKPRVVLVYQAETQLTLLCFLDSLVNNSGHLRGDSIICCDDAKVREYCHDIGSSMLLITRIEMIQVTRGVNCATAKHVSNVKPVKKVLVAANKLFLRGVCKETSPHM